MAEETATEEPVKSKSTNVILSTIAAALVAAGVYVNSDTEQKPITPVIEQVETVPTPEVNTVETPTEFVPEVPVTEEAPVVEVAPEAEPTPEIKTRDDGIKVKRVYPNAKPKPKPIPRIAKKETHVVTKKVVFKKKFLSKDYTYDIDVLKNNGSIIPEGYNARFSRTGD